MVFSPMAHEGLCNFESCIRCQARCQCWLAWNLSICLSVCVSCQSFVSAPKRNSVARFRINSIPISIPMAIWVWNLDLHSNNSNWTVGYTNIQCKQTSCINMRITLVVSATFWQPIRSNPMSVLCRDIWMGLDNVVVEIYESVDN